MCTNYMYVHVQCTYVYVNVHVCMHVYVFCKWCAIHAERKQNRGEAKIEGEEEEEEEEEPDAPPKSKNCMSCLNRKKPAAGPDGAAV